jgi:hypothetical protein
MNQAIFLGLLQNVAIFVAAILLGDTLAHTFGIFFALWALMPVLGE